MSDYFLARLTCETTAGNKWSLLEAAGRPPRWRCRGCCYGSDGTRLVRDFSFHSAAGVRFHGTIHCFVTSRPDTYRGFTERPFDLTTKSKGSGEKKKTTEL